MNAATLVELLIKRANANPRQRAFTFLESGERAEGSLTFGELLLEAKLTAAGLQERGLAGEPVLLLLPQGLEYVSAFFGCVLAGAIPIPLFPPKNRRRDTRIDAIVADSQARVALVKDDARSPGSGISPLRFAECRGDRWKHPNVSGENPVFLQYTSGSTGDPKGVVVTHAKLLANQRMIATVFATSEHDVIASWLPLFHDMGLVGTMLHSVYAGACVVFMSPAAFLQRPARWLRAISEYKATISGGPNAAFDLCVDRARSDDLAGLDLSCWRVAFNGSEPVRAATMDRFGREFAPYGFRTQAWRPCYGLAEAALFVSAGIYTPGGNVSCGPPAPGLEVAVVGSESRITAGAGETGEIWLRGPSIAAGYWRRAAEPCFNGRLASGDGPFLRTGDLGRVVDGEIHVTGRLKDLIIIRGRNLYPQDIESVAEHAHPSLLRHAAAAFSVEPDGREELVLVVEAQAGSGEALEAIRIAVANEFDVSPAAIVLVRQGAVPKTSSGKIRRRKCRELFEARSLQPLAEWRESAVAIPGSSAIDLISLRRVLAGALRVDETEVDVSQPLAELGLDSVGAMEFAAAVERISRRRVSAAELFEKQMSLTDVAAHLERSAPVALPPAADDYVWQPLSEGQKALYFEHQANPREGRYNLALGARLIEPRATSHVAELLRNLPLSYPALGMQFGVSGGDVAQRVGRRQIPVAVLPAASIDMAQEALAPFDLEVGVARAVVWEDEGKAVALLVVVHHIVADLWSVGLVLRDPCTVRDSASAFSHVHEERRWMESSDAAAALAFWRTELHGAPELRLELPAPEAYRPHVAALRRIDAGLTRRVMVLCREQGFTPHTLLMAALQVLLSRWSGQSDFIVGSPMSVRSGASQSVAAGYLANLAPYRARLQESRTIAGHLIATRQASWQALRHGRYPFARLVTDLRMPPVHALLAWQNPPSDAPCGLAAFALDEAGARMELGDLELECTGPLGTPPPLPLTLRAARIGEEIHLSLAYDARRFRSEDMIALLESMEHLLRQFAEDLTLPLARLVLPPAPCRTLPEGASGETGPKIGHAAHVAPRSAREQLLAQIWKEVLGCHQVGVHESFFDLGGDSITSITVRARAREQGLDFTIPELFESQTVERLAQIARSVPQGEVPGDGTALSLLCKDDRASLPTGIEDAYPLTLLQAGLIFHSEHSSDYETYVTSLHVRTTFDRQSLCEAVRRSLHRHPILRTTFDLSSYSEPLQLVWRPESVTLEPTIIDISFLPESEQRSAIDEWLLAERARRPRWGAFPLLRFTVHVRSAAAFQLTLSEPFLDGWSVATLLSQVLSEYSSLIKGNPLPAVIPAPGVHEYVALERAALQSEELTGYWRGAIDGDCVGGLSLGRANLPGGRSTIGRVEREMPRAFADTLRAAAGECRVPFRTILLAAHLKVVACWTGSNDVLTGLLLNGRPERAGFESAVGLFLNAVPFRAAWKTSSRDELLRQIHRREVELLRFRHYPVAAIQKLHGGRTLFDTVFNYTHFHAYKAVDEIAGVAIEGGYASEQTFFDLTAQFNVDHRSGALRIALDYRTERFDAEQAALLLASYESEVRALASRGHAPQLAASHKGRRAQWNGKPAVESDPAIHELIRPGAPAGRSGAVSIAVAAARPLPVEPPRVSLWDAAPAQAAARSSCLWNARRPAGGNRELARAGARLLEVRADGSAEPEWDGQLYAVTK